MPDEIHEVTRDLYHSVQQQVQSILERHYAMMLVVQPRNSVSNYMTIREVLITLLAQEMLSSACGLSLQENMDPKEIFDKLVERIITSIREIKYEKSLESAQEALSRYKAERGGTHETVLMRTE